MRRRSGIAGLTRSLAREIGSRGITVNASAPGYYSTDIPECSRTRTRGAAPANSFGAPRKSERWPPWLAFLASPQAAYITGATLHVNGGMYMS